MIAGMAESIQAANAGLKMYLCRVIRRRLLANDHNTTFRLDFEDRTSAVFKIHRYETNSPVYERSEMQWIDALARETDLLVPRPIRNRDGELVTTIHTAGGNQWICRMMTWVPGRRLFKRPRPYHLVRLG